MSLNSPKKTTVLITTGLVDPLYMYKEHIYIYSTYVYIYDLSLFTKGAWI